MLDFRRKFFTGGRLLLSILIVNWNTRKYLQACLESVQRACAGLEYEVIVVDNGSKDGSAAMVTALFPEVRLFALKENLGFSGGNNFAYEQAHGEWIWLLNPDTEVLESAPQLLIEFLKDHPQAGAVASALIDMETKKPQRSCRTFPTPAALWSEATLLAKLFPRSRRFGFYRMGWWDYNDTRRVEQPMASSFLLRRAAIEAIYNEEIGGLFDEEFPIFFNDVDLCWRLWEADWEIWYLPTARVRHYGGASTRQLKPEMIAVSHRGLERFYQKHYQGRVSPLLYKSTLLLIRLSGALREWLARSRFYGRI